MADAFEEEPEETVSLTEFLKEVDDQELEADLVLGADEGTECTYVKGYMKRQAIFSCLTCTPEGNAGVCTACCLTCHDGHEMIELWTKRNFKCDCGNSKFGVSYCKLLPSKDNENGENSYNQNFKGKYCTCGRPYPDPDAENPVEEMIQCCVCEDWFHEEHLGPDSTNEIPRDEEGEPLYEDLICHMCSSTCSFLQLYPQIICAPHKQQTAATTSKEKGVETAPSASGSSTMPENGSTSVIYNVDPGVPDRNSKSVHDDKGLILGEKSDTCVLGVDLLTTELTLGKSQPMFLVKNWREALCRCGKCSDFYARKKISFLLDKEDSIAEYEKLAKQKRDEKMQQQEGADLDFLGNLGHVTKMEILSGIADMKDELQSFLQSFDGSKPITPDDVRQVFDNLKKRRRMD
uniref:putative E3 ubiquitin-protein ligase UBR7 isoform X1 n=1 Tax=Erigeron canadensis TaxID=72917 RepID=UPI001CB9A5C8|nr:putative E3 ubiquitin-protein ligase UBR7 isoform X1 [Erigeron canadensis]